MSVVKQQDSLDVFVKTQRAALRADRRTYNATRDATDDLHYRVRGTFVAQLRRMDERINERIAILGALRFLQNCAADGSRVAAPFIMALLAYYNADGVPNLVLWHDVLFGSVCLIMEMRSQYAARVRQAEVAGGKAEQEEETISVRIGESVKKISLGEARAVARFASLIGKLDRVRRNDQKSQTEEQLLQESEHRLRDLMAQGIIDNVGFTVNASAILDAIADSDLRVDDTVPEADIAYAMAGVLDPAYWQFRIDTFSSYIDIYGRHIDFYRWLGAKANSLSAGRARQAEVEAHKVKADVLPMEADIELTDVSTRLADGKCAGESVEGMCASEQEVADTFVPLRVGSQKLQKGGQKLGESAQELSGLKAQSAVQNPGTDRKHAGSVAATQKFLVNLATQTDATGTEAAAADTRIGAANARTDAKVTASKKKTGVTRTRAVRKTRAKATNLEKKTGTSSFKGFCDTVWCRILAIAAIVASFFLFLGWKLGMCQKRVEC